MLGGVRDRYFKIKLWVVGSSPIPRTNTGVAQGQSNSLTKACFACSPSVKKMVVALENEFIDF